MEGAEIARGLGRNKRPGVEHGGGSVGPRGAPALQYGPAAAGGKGLTARAADDARAANHGAGRQKLERLGLGAPPDGRPDREVEAAVARDEADLLLRASPPELRLRRLGRHA